LEALDKLNDQGDSHYVNSVFSQLHLMKGELIEPLPLVIWIYCKYIDRMVELLSWL